MRRSSLVFAVQLTLGSAALGWAAPQDPILPLAPEASPTTQASQILAATETPETSEVVRPKATPSYILGPDDVIAIKALDAEEISGGGIRIDQSGTVSLPLLGRVTAAGLTVEHLERELATRLKTYVREPIVSVTVTEYHSQPVTVIGAVGRSGVHQLEGRKRLLEILAMAGGLRPDAGNVVKITRKAESGEIPLASAVKDASGQFTVANVNLRNIMQATSPEENILILPNDVISVPQADVVYVMGEVKKPGGFVLQERSSISGLQALAMAQGFTPTASASKAMIIRQSGGAKQLTIAADLSKILSGQQPDVDLQPDDILLVPKNATRSALGNAISTAIRATTSAIIYRGLF